MMLLQRYFVFISKEIVDLVSLKTRKLHLHSSERFNWDHRSTDMHEVVVDIILLSVFLFMITYFLQGKEEDSDMTIRMERSSPLFSEEVVLDKRTGMIGTVRAVDDEEVLVILRSMKSAVSHFVGDKKYLSA